jgi:thiol:disulfide interchange protein
MSDGESNHSGDFFPRLAFFALIAIVGFVGWRWLVPRSTLTADGRDPVWHDEIRQSIDEKRPAVVLFTANWCPACRQLHETALADPAVKEELRSGHTFIVVDLTRPTAADQMHYRAMGISAIPTIVRFDADGHETARAHGMPSDQMLAWLREN